VNKQITTEKFLTAAVFERLCREVCNQPRRLPGQSHNAQLTEANYWYALWHKVADFIEWEDRQPQPNRDGVADLVYWRAQVISLVGEHESEPIYVMRTATSHISQAAGNAEDVTNAS
jgi:hypothetical protein